MTLKYFLVLVVSLVWLGTASLWGDTSLMPGPFRIQISFDPAWKAVSEVVTTKNLKIRHAEKSQGKLITGFHEYSSGPIVESHIDKIGVRPKLIDAEWIRVRFQYLISFEFVEENETLVFVNADIEALKRNFLGHEEWVEIPSNGKLETDFLTDFGKHLFGQKFRLDLPKKRFWEKPPPPGPLKEEPFFKFID